MSYKVHNTEVSTLGQINRALKASPYSNQTLKRNGEGNFSPIVGAAISVTENPLRIAGSTIGLYTLVRLTMKMFGAPNDSFLNSRGGLAALGLTTVVPFLADSLIPREAGRESPMLLPVKSVQEASNAPVTENVSDETISASREILRKLLNNWDLYHSLRPGQTNEQYSFLLASVTLPTLDIELFSEQVNGKLESYLQVVDEESNIGKTEMVGLRIKVDDLVSAFETNHKVAIQVIKKDTNAINLIFKPYGKPYLISTQELKSTPYGMGKKAVA